MKRKFTEKKGQSLIEYVALTALVAIVCITAVRSFGGRVQRRLNQISSSFEHNLQLGMKYNSNKADNDSEDDAPGPRSNRGMGSILKIPRIF